MPGIGPRTGARVLAEISDGSAFANGSKFAAYGGLAPLRPVTGVGPKLADAELVTPAVRQALPYAPGKPGGYGVNEPGIGHLVGAVTVNDGGPGFPQDLQVEGERPVFHVTNVEPDCLIPSQV
jgi:Transposase IS116/IS110/IS902 family